MVQYILGYPTLQIMFLNWLVAGLRYQKGTCLNSGYTVYSI